MLFLSTFFAVSVSSTVLVPVQTTMPPICFVVGEIDSSVTGIRANLTSNCPIEIQQKDHFIIMRSKAGQYRTFTTKIPDEPGPHEFVYRFGHSTARFDEEKLEVRVGSFASLQP